MIKDLKRIVATLNLDRPLSASRSIKGRHASGTVGQQEAAISNRQGASKRQGSRSSSAKANVVLLSLALLPGVLAAQDLSSLMEEGKPQLSRVESEPSLGNTHLPPGTPVAEDEPFPLSGPHWPRATPSGFYDEAQPKGQLIHALEHGQVVVYYDKPGFKAMSVLKEWAKDQASDWSGLIAVPHEGLDAALVLTAWQHRLDLPTFDEAALAAFIDAYSGRGPENPVR